MNGNLKRGLIAIFSANIINLIFNILTNFLLPKYLSVDSYVAIKTFQLYITYVGIFSLGYADGMYLRYGGKKLEQINKQEIQDGLVSFRFVMLIESLVLIFAAYIYGNIIILAFCFTILSMNMTNYFKNLYQAVGEFKLYGKILNWTTITTFFANIVLLFLIKTDNYVIYLICYIIVDASIWLALEYNMYKIMKNEHLKGKFSFSIVLDDIKSGFLLMIGNFSNIMLSSMDRWFVKIMMNTSEFAYYSFAVSMEGFLNVAITPITITLYNYFCNHLEEKEVVKRRKQVIIFSSIIIATLFPAKFAIKIFLNNYIESINVLAILFASQFFYIIIKGIYVNLYKAMKMQKRYFLKLLAVLIIGAILNYIFVKIHPFKEAFSVGTLISATIWLILCIYDFKKYIFTKNEVIYIFIEIIVFLLAGCLLNSIVGLLAYIIVTLIMIRFFMKEELKDIISLVGTVIEKIKNGKE